MKKHLCLLICCILLMVACKNTFDEAQSSDAKFDSAQNESLTDFLTAEFGKIMDEGGKLFSSIDGIVSLSTEEQFKAFQTADGYTSKMKESYLSIIRSCQHDEALAFLVYQVRLLDRACPLAIAGSDAASLANQNVLYQLYLQQISSSFSYLSVEMERLSGKDVEWNEVSFFDEVPEMPTPDSIIFDISFDSKKTVPGSVQYVYLLGEDDTDASMNYNIYLSAVELDDTLSVAIEDTYCYVLKNNAVVSIMMAGNDPIKGFFLIVSFQE